MLVTEWSLHESQAKGIRNSFDFLNQWLLLLPMSQAKHSAERLTLTLANHAHQNRHQLGENSGDQSGGADQDELVDDVHHHEVQLECFGSRKQLGVRILEDVRKQLEVLPISRIIVLLPKLAHLDEL